MPHTCWKSATTLLLAGILLTGGSVGTAQIYKYRDEQGNVVFSDRKPSTNEANKDVEEVTLKATNTTPPTTPRTSDTPPVKNADQERVVYSTVITQPTSNTTIPMGPGNFTVTAQAKPPLQEGEALRLMLDGSPVGPEQTQTHWALNNVFRGEHTLLVERLNQDSKPVHQSAPVVVYVLRPSVRR